MKSYEALARLYDAFMDDVDHKAWAEYVAALLRSGNKNTKTLLECGCGTGSITLYMKRAGFDITASDVSSEMLETASEKARSMGFRIPFVKMDMRNISLHRPVDAVIACNDCVNYLTDENALADFFNSAFSCLKTGGCLAFDISSEYKLEKIIGDNCFSDSREKMAYFWSNHYDKNKKLAAMELEFFTLKEGTELYERSFESHVQRAYSESEIRELLEKCGFSDIKAYEAFTFEAPNEKTQRIQFVCQKN